MEFMCNIPKFPLSYRFFQLTIKISQLPTSSMPQVCYNFWIKGRQPELMSTLGICPFSLFKTSLASLVCADVRNFFTLVCHNVMSDQKQGFSPGQGHGDKAQLGKCHLLGGQSCEKDELPASRQHCSLQPAFWGRMLSTAGGQTEGICQELHLAHSVEKGLQWFAAQMWNNMHLSRMCRAEIPRQCLQIRQGTRWLARRQHCWE